MKKALILLGVLAAMQTQALMANTSVTATGQNDDPSVNCTMINNSTGAKVVAPTPEADANPAGDGSGR